MINIPGFTNRWCNGVSRRDFLQIGGLGAAGLALPDFFRARAQGSTPPARGAGRAKACILLFMGVGIVADTELTDALGRPFRLCQGKAIREVLA